MSLFASGDGYRRLYFPTAIQTRNLIGQKSRDLLQLSVKHVVILKFHNQRMLLESATAFSMSVAFSFRVGIKQPFSVSAVPLFTEL